MKIDVQGIEEIKSTMETPFQALAQQLNEKGCLDKQTTEIVTFIFEQFAKLGEKPWEIVD
tara:strand:- start:483 stop:662 length:180 start_codon:yes stop_codon:yes gene_type:complete